MKQMSILTLLPHRHRRLLVNSSKCELGEVVRADPVSEVQPHHDMTSQVCSGQDERRLDLGQRSQEVGMPPMQCLSSRQEGWPAHSTCSGFHPEKLLTPLP